MIWGQTAARKLRKSFQSKPLRRPGCLVSRKILEHLTPAFQNSFCGSVRRTGGWGRTRLSQTALLCTPSFTASKSKAFDFLISPLRRYTTGIVQLEGFVRFGGLCTMMSTNPLGTSWTRLDFLQCHRWRPTSRHSVRHRPSAGSICRWSERRDVHPSSPTANHNLPNCVGRSHT